LSPPQAKRCAEIKIHPAPCDAKTERVFKKIKNSTKQKMKIKNLFLIAVATASLAVSAFAASPNYQTLGPSIGTAASPATIIIPADPVLTPRIVTVNWSSDTNNAMLNCTAGTTAYVVTNANATTSSTLCTINSTNGLAATGTLVLQKLNGVCYSQTYSSYANTGGSNVVTLASGGFGVAQAVNDSVYLMSTPATALPIGATTNYMSGDAIYVGNAARPIVMQLTPALNTNKLNSLIVRFD
jgi:hypothetical protein